MATNPDEAIPTGRTGPLARVRGMVSSVRENVREGREARQAERQALAPPGGRPHTFRGRFQNYIRTTPWYADLEAKRTTTDYQKLLNERMRGLIDEEAITRGEADFQAAGRTLGQVAQTPFDFNLSEVAQAASPSGPAEAVPTTSTRDPATAAVATTSSARQVLDFPGDTIPPVTGQNWRDYRQAYIKNLKDRGVNARQIQAFDRGFTEFQQEKFQELGRSAYQAMELGNLRAAAKLAQAAYQWFPTDNEVEFQESGQGLRAIFRDNETGEVVGARNMTSEDMLGMLERFKDPKAWYSFTSDKSAKERGEILEALDREIQASEVEVARMNAEANMVNAEANRTNAARGARGSAGLIPADLQMTDVLRQLQTMREQEALAGEGGKLATEQDMLGVLSLTDRLVRAGHAPADALNTVYSHWGEADLERRLIQQGLLPQAAVAAGAEPPGKSMTRGPAVRSGDRGFADGGQAGGAGAALLSVLGGGEEKKERKTFAPAEMPLGQNQWYADGGRVGDPKVGPADPATRRRMMEEHVRAGRAHKSAGRAAPSAPAQPPPHRELRRGPEGRTVMESVDRMQRGYRDGGPTRPPVALPGSETRKVPPRELPRPESGPKPRRIPARKR